MQLSPKLAGTLMLIMGLSASVQAQTVKPDYQFDQLSSVTSVNNSRIDGWSAVNDQVLIMSTGSKRKYLVVLTRPNRDLVFSYQLGVTNSAGRILPKFDKVYALNNPIQMGVPIKKIYLLADKKEEALARKLVAEAEEQAKLTHASSDEK